MSVSRIKKDDVVIVNSGSNRGKTGKVLAIDLKRERAVVEGVNLVKIDRTAVGGENK